MSSLHNPLELGQPISVVTEDDDLSPLNRALHGHAAPQTPLAASQSAGAQDTTAHHATHHDPTNPVPPRLHHTRTAPTTFPVNPVAHQGYAAQNDPDEVTKRGLAPIRDEEGGQNRWSGTVPLEAGGLHGQPMPGSHAAMQGLHREPEHDNQAGTTGGRSGHNLAEKAAAELGLPGARGGKKGRSNTLDEKTGSVPFAKIDRTATGTRINRHVKTGGRDTVQGYGMMPIVRQPSLPPAVGPFGGTAPDGPDAEEGLWAVRSHEEELARQKTMDAKGPDPWAVRFVPGDPENPKASTASYWSV
jgi:hypothetical protein